MGTTDIDAEAGIIHVISIHVPAMGTTFCSCPDRPAPDISIHVPAMGTTDTYAVIDVNPSISIHVPAMGATLWAARGFTMAEDFNPRARDGHDLRDALRNADGTNFNPRARDGHDLFFLRIAKRLHISIHVPAMGTTGVVCELCLEAIISIHVPAMGTTEAPHHFNQL